MKLTKRDIRNLKARIRRQVRGWGGQDKITDRNMMTWIAFAIDGWAKKAAKP